VGGCGVIAESGIPLTLVCIQCSAPLYADAGGPGASVPMHPGPTPYLGPSDHAQCLHNLKCHGDSVVISSVDNSPHPVDIIPWWPYACSCQVTALNSFPPVRKNPIVRRIPFIRHHRLISPQLMAIP
jgi:hypothetical protein